MCHPTHYAVYVRTYTGHWSRCLGYRWLGMRYGECSSSYWGEMATASTSMIFFETAMYFAIPVMVGLISYSTHLLLTKKNGRFTFDDALVDALLGELTIGRWHDGPCPR